ncbi:MAG: hypothetical protein CMJ84_03375 [Planctomycetes bacterium]|nr:hypothetical protein [Planctomycetota bacterium]
MKLERIDLHDAPGLPDGLAPLALEPGLVVIVGPNGSGKSTLARAVRALLWPEEVIFAGRLSSHWRHAGKAHDASAFAEHVTWDSEPSCTIPPKAAALARFGIRSLLADADGSDRDMAREVARALAGGLDLDEAAAAFDHKLRWTARSPVAKGLTDGKRRVKEARRVATSLAGKEPRLVELDILIEEALDASGRLEAAKQLREWLRTRAERAELDRRRFSPGLERLVGDEVERSAELAAAVAKAHEEQRRTMEAIEAAKEEIASAAFDGDPPPEEELEAWQGRIDKIEGAATRVVDLRQTSASAAERRDEAAAGVLENDGSVEPGREELRELSERIAGLHGARAIAESIRSAEGIWADWAEGAAETGPLREAVDGLRRWLRAPDGESCETSAPPRVLAWTLILAGLACLAAAFLLPAPWLASGLGLSGAGIALLLWARPRARPRAGSPSTAGATYRAELQGSEFAPPSWERPRVEEHLRELERQYDTGVLATRARQHLEEVRRRGSAAERDLGEADAAHAAAAAAAGVRAECADFGSLVQVQALVRWLEARSDHADRELELLSAEAILAEELAACAEWLAPLGHAEVADAPAARAAVRGVERRRTAHRSARRSFEQATAALEVRAKESEELEGRLDMLWERSGVERDDHAGLARRVEEHAQRCDHVQRVRESDQAVEAARIRFVEAAELPALVDREPESVAAQEVEGWIVELEEEAERLGGWREERGGLKKELELAAQGEEMADAIAALRSAERAAAEDRDRALEDALARMLIEQVRTHHASSHPPAHWRRARELFARFTHDQWRLELDSDGRFCAVDVAADRRRSLDELSDATRIQLLIAARFAALESLEGETIRVPICFDEALSTTDPARFKAIAAALLELVADGRQLLYFTADPTEAAQWCAACAELSAPAPQVINLDAAAAAGGEWGASLPATPVPDAPVPRPGDATPEEYAELLRVGVPDGAASPSSWHLFFVLFDELEALAACLRLRCQRLGHWRTARERGCTPAALPPSLAQRVDARLALLEALARLWNVGRGRPVRWEDVRDCEAVSTSFIDQARELLTEHARDPAAYLDAVRSLKSFRSAKAAELSEHLRSVGCICDEPSLAPDEILRRCLEEAPEATAELGPESAGSLVEWVLDLL